jgi:hypothetical protein
LGSGIAVILEADKELTSSVSTLAHHLNDLHHWLVMWVSWITCWPADCHTDSPLIVPSECIMGTVSLDTILYFLALLEIKQMLDPLLPKSTQWEPVWLNPCFTLSLWPDDSMYIQGYILCIAGKHRHFI